MLSLFCAQYFNRDAEETLPTVTYIFMLLLYLAGIAGVIAHAVELLILFIISGTAFFAFLGYKKNGKKFFVNSINVIRSPGIIVFLCFTVIGIIVSLHLRVTNWDDLHYWAIFPRDMFVINGVPTGGMSSTLYQDYFPVVQYLYYLVFKIIGRFSEPAMFAVNYFLLLLGLMPFFRKAENKKDYFLSVFTGIILPSVCSYQLYYCLGVDIIMTFFFGQALIYIFDKKRDLFYYIKFAAATTILTMSKTTGLIFAAIAIGIFAVVNFKLKLMPIVMIFLTGISNLAFYFSWKRFCYIKGNTTYLSNVLNSNIEDRSGFRLPEYASKTFGLFVKAFFTEHLNGSLLGLTPAVMLIISLFIIIAVLRGQKEKLRPGLELAVMLCGMAGYLAVILYIYLFVFDKWEALSLSSYERYIATFFGGILCVTLYYYIRNYQCKKKLIKPALAIVLFLTVNFRFMYNAWTPWGFDSNYGNMTALIDNIYDELQGVFTEDMHYGDEIVFVDGKDDMARSKSIPYCAVPYVSRIMSLIDKDSYTAGELLDMAAERDTKYMVFMKRVEGEKAVVTDEEALFENGGKVEEDVLYKYDKEKNVLYK